MRMRKREELGLQFRVVYLLWVLRVLLDPPEGVVAVKGYEGCMPEKMVKIYPGMEVVDIREFFEKLEGKPLKDPRPLLVGVQETVEETTIMTFAPDNRLAGLFIIPAAVRFASMTPEMRESVRQLNRKATLAGLNVTDIFFNHPDIHIPG